MHKGPGGELRYIVFNFDTMPFGAKAADADPAKALAVRQAMAHVVDRGAIASQVYKDTYLPAYSVVPDGFVGAIQPLKEMYGDGSGKPSIDKAKKAFEDAGVTAPVTIKLQYNPDHYGKSSGDEYAMIKEQLEKSGLFTVELQSTEWVDLLAGSARRTPTPFTSSAGSRTTPTPTTTSLRSSSPATS